MAYSLLSAASVFRTIGSILLAILILLVMITIHEFGHWIAGRILHFGITEFSIGFGPALFKRKNKKTDEIFAIRLIPLGGYCAFQGEDGLDEEEEKKKDFLSEKAETPAEEIFPDIEKDPAKETVILTPAAQAPAPAPEEKEAVKEETAAEKVTEETLTQAAQETPKKEKRIPQWKQKPDDGSFTRKAPWKRIIVLVAGAFMNYILALFLIIICFFAYGQTMLAAYEVEKDDGFYTEHTEYCLQDKDIFLKANGKNLYMATDLARALNGKKAGDKVKLYISRYFVDETRFNEETKEEEPVKWHREKMEVEVMLRADVKIKNSSDLNSAWKGLGIKYSTEEGNKGYMLANATAKFGFFETLGRSFVYSWKIAGSIFHVIGELLTGRLGLSAMGGPVSTITVTSQAVAMGFRYFLEIAALIGVNLAVFNLLPVPALDGSKVVFTIIEWARGKPISRKIEAIIHAVGFVLLLGFAVLVDILQFV